MKINITNGCKKKILFLKALGKQPKTIAKIIPAWDNSRNEVFLTPEKVKEIIAESKLPEEESEEYLL